MIVYAILEKPIGQPDSSAQVRRESPGRDDTKLRMLRGANLAPSATLTRSASGTRGNPSLARRVSIPTLRRARRDGRGTLPKSCNRLQ